MTRILHTSDWHLGASLEGFVPREGEHERFLRWLTGAVVEHAVDVLVVAGDVFDHAQPSAEAQRLYYRFLAGLRRTPVRSVVIVGGNHDSASRLDAPRDLLDNLSIHVVGGTGGDEEAWERCVCPVRDASGSIEAVVLAVPYIHEFWLGVRAATADPIEVQATIRSRLTERYRVLADRAESLGNGAPIVATGHLTCLGVEPGDAPYDIHEVGRIGALPPSLFDSRIEYVALGHLHRMFRVETSAAWYSGSPIPLSFKEAGTPRHVMLVETTHTAGAQPTVTPLRVPLARSIVKITGSQAEVEAALDGLVWSTELSPLVYVEVTVEQHRAGIDLRLQEIVEKRKSDRPVLLRASQTVANETLPAEPEATTRSLRDHTPEEVFRRLMIARGELLDDRLLAAFRSLVHADAGAEAVAKELAGGSGGKS